MTSRTVEVSGAEPPSPLIRVHKTPEVLRRPPDGLDRRQCPRFDDPLGRFGVRYLASTLRGCLVETMARFRSDREVERLLDSISDVDDGDPDPSRYDGLTEWLAQQRIGHCTILTDPMIVDVDGAETLIALDHHPYVRAALARSGLGTATKPVRLDGGVIRLSGPVGRPITQAASRAIAETLPSVHGLSYESRIDENEQCWALFEHCPVRFVMTPLSSEHPEHVTAVRSVASLFDIDLPSHWSERP